MNSRTLNYVIKKKLESINLDLWEAEAYYNAIIVQSLIGNLVYHSNHGRYEPRLAEKWSRVSPTRWEFTLREGMTCENGERITTESFKRSIERSILAGLVNGEPPVLNKLVGYREFVKERNSLLGIQAIGNILAFDFTSPVRDGVVQTLSYAPYGYICADNINPDGKWKDPYKFISSGPYKVAEIQKGKLYVLEMRHEWEGISHPKSPRKIRITDIIPNSLAESSHFILDFYEAPKNTPKSVQVYKLVPEYLVAVFFGNLETGFFGRKENREKFKRLMERNRDLMPLSFFGYQTRADSFFAVASTKNRPITSATMSDLKDEIQERPLIIEGTEPPESSARITGWKILKKSLDEANLKYEFAGNQPSWQEHLSQKYDLRISAPSLGGALQPWSMELLFCSVMGPIMPDPSGRVCGLLDDFAKEKVELLEFEKKFLEIVDDDAAIVPISHFGVQLFLSPSINPKSLSPALNVIRFDQLEME